MFNYLPHELSFLQSLLSHRPEILNPFFIAIHHLDSGGFYLLVATLIYTCLNPRLGKAYFLLSAICFASNYGLKHWFLQPRPLVLEPSLGLVPMNSLYGLPSGAAQAATALAVFLNYHFKHRGLFWGSVVYVMMICLSRVYLGVHFISDVVVGGLLGAAMTFSLLKLGEYLPAKKLEHPEWMILGLALVVLAIVWPMPYTYQVALGMVSGVLISHVLFKDEPYSRGWCPVMALGLLISVMQVNQHVVFPPSLIVSVYLLLLSWITHRWGRTPSLSASVTR